MDPTYLHPAEMCFAPEPARVETVLGSCVAVTMWDRRQGVSCICHAVLPRSIAGENDPWRYVDSSIARMLAVLESHGTRRADLEVKLFGGASMYARRPNHTSVGEQNIEAALDALAGHGLTPAICDTGGRHGRKLRFYSATGEVWVKRIRMESEQ